MPPPAPLGAFADAVNELAAGGAWCAQLERRHGHCVDVFRRGARYDQLVATIWLREGQLVGGPPGRRTGGWHWPADDAAAAAASLLELLKAV
jgi:hypothetical protein